MFDRMGQEARDGMAAQFLKPGESLQEARSSYEASQSRDEPPYCPKTRIVAVSCGVTVVIA